VLPEFPVAFIFHRINIIMSNPIRIRIKYRIIKIAGLELIRSIKNRLYFIMSLYFIQPYF